MNAAGQRFCHGAIPQGNLGIKLKALPFRDNALLREAAVTIHTDRAEGFAHLLLAHLAIAAFSAVYIGVHRDVVAHRNRAYPASNLFHHAGKLMAKNHRGDHIRGTLVSMIDMDIRSTHAAGFDPHDDFVLIYLSECDLFCLKLTISKKIGSFHCITSLSSYVFPEYKALPKSPLALWCSARRPRLQN